MEKLEMNYLNEKPLVTNIETNHEAYASMFFESNRMQSNLTGESANRNWYYRILLNGWGITKYKIKEEIKKQPRGNRGGVAHLKRHNWKAGGTLSS